MRILKSIFKITFVYILVIFVILWAFMLVLYNDSTIRPSKNHSLDAYGEDLGIDLPASKLVAKYKTRDGENIDCYLVYSLDSNTAIEDLTTLGFYKNSDYDEEITRIEVNICGENKISSDHYLNTYDEKYVLNINPKLGYEYYLVYKPKNNYLFILYSWNNYTSIG